MAFGRDEAGRRRAARQHSLYAHTCPRCKRVVYGNAYYNHKAACKRRFEQQAHAAQEAP